MSGYQGYLTARAAEKEATKQMLSSQKQAAKVKASANGKSKPAKPQKSKRSKNEQRKFERQLETMEKMVGRMELQFEKVSAELQTASETGNFEKIRAATENYKSAENDLNISLEAWEKLAAEVE